MLGHYVATQNPGGVQIHQYISSDIAVSRATGGSLALRLETGVPWEGWARLTLTETSTSPWTLALRIPSWAQGTRLHLNGVASEPTPSPGTYAEITRIWQAGDRVDLDMPIDCRLIEPHPRVDALRGTLAIERGPLVYCLEQIDQGVEADLLDIRIDPSKTLKSIWRDDLLGGVMVVEASGSLVDVSGWRDWLYRPLSKEQSASLPLTLTAVPYFAWANLGPGAMRVWLPSM